MKYYLLFTFLLLATLRVGAQVLPSPEEYQALMDLYSATNTGTGWTNQTGWSDADPNVIQSVQGWYGITTDAQGHVIYLNIGPNNLNGSLPSSIGNLTHLQSLSLPNNLINGSLPAEIGNLVDLIYVNLSGNKISGSIPSAIGSLTNVTNLFLNSNFLTGPIPSQIGMLESLSGLYLQSNQLSGAIPSELGSLSNLKILELGGGNSLSGAIPSTFGNLTKLESVRLSDNQLTGFIPVEIGNLSNVNFMDLGNNHLSGSIPASVGNLSKLNYLSIGANQLTGSIPQQIGGLVAVSELYLHSNQLSGAIPEEIGLLTNLKQLTLDGGNSFSGAIPLAFGNLTKLETLRLTDNQLTGFIPVEIGNLSNVNFIDLGNNHLTGTIPSSMGRLSKLNYLSLGANQLSGALPPELGNLSQLTQLYLHSNNFSGQIPASLRNISYLDQVSISFNRFTFSDFLSVKQAKPQLTVYPQGAVDIERTIQGVLNSSFALTATIDRTTTPASVYQWFKYNVNGSTALNTASTEGHTVIIPSLTQEDEGTQYFYTITNPDVEGMSLSSHLQTLQVITCDTPPALDFQFTESNSIHSFTPAFNPAEGCTVIYSWEFGDGTVSAEASPTHKYLNGGSFTVRLTASYQCEPCANSLTKEYQIDISNGGLCSSIYCDGVGGVGINTRQTDGFALSVKGKIRASDIIKVYSQTQWADFVFEKNYHLPTLLEVEKYIRAHGHLPGIPSAKEVEKEGVELGAMNAHLLQKIEELTLYMIEINKEGEILKKENAKVKAQLRILSKKIDEAKSPENAH